MLIVWERKRTNLDFSSSLVFSILGCMVGSHLEPAGRAKWGWGVWGRRALCLFVCCFASSHFLSIFALLFYAFTFEMFSVFCTGFSFCKMFDSIACVFSPCILYLTLAGGGGGGGFCVCVWGICLHFAFYLGMRRGGLYLILYMFVYFFTLVWGGEVLGGVGICAIGTLLAQLRARSHPRQLLILWKNENSVFEKSNMYVLYVFV